MSMRSFFVEIQKLIVEDLNDDANFEDEAYLGVFKKMFKAENLKQRYFELLDRLRDDYRISNDSNRFTMLKQNYMSFHAWLCSQIFPGYCWEEERVLFGRRGVARCLKSKNELRFESEEKEMEFVEKYCALYVNYYCREHGEKVVCDYIVEVDKTLCKDLEEIAGRSVCDDKEIVSRDKFDDGVVLPPELEPERVGKYFIKAIKVGYMEKDGNGYKWLFGGNKGQARLGYFCNKVFKQPRPINILEDLFKVKKLSASITAAGVEVKRADAKRWREEMNNIIFND